MGTDLGGASVAEAFLVSVGNTNDTPALTTLTGQSIRENEAGAMVGVLSTIDPDAGDSVRYSILSEGNGGQFAVVGNTLRVGANGLNYEEQANRSVTVRATDTGGLYLDTTFSISVTDVNEAPVVANAVGDQTVMEDTPFSFLIPVDSFVDPDAGDALSFAASTSDGNALPEWLDFNPVTRRFSGMAGNAEGGRLQINLTATDPTRNSTPTHISL